MCLQRAVLVLELLRQGDAAVVSATPSSIDDARFHSAANRFDEIQGLGLDYR
jgi:hypothetical protein